MNMTIEVDARDLGRLLARCTPDLYRDAVRSLFVDVAHDATGLVHARTPVLSGNLRRSEQADVTRAGNLPHPSSRVSTRTEYAWWVETGATKSGRRMRRKPGGYRMFEETALEMDGRVPGHLSAVAGRIEEAWGR